MDPFDKRQTDPVWQRVTARTIMEPPPQETELRPTWFTLSNELQTTAELYVQLARHLAGKDGQVLERLAHDARQDATCLRGMGDYHLGAGAPAAVKTALPKDRSLGLRAAIGRELELQNALEATGERVAQILAMDSARRRRTLYTLLGSQRRAGFTANGPRTRKY